jgi:hypothetical protein
MDEHVFAAAVWLDEAITLCGIEPLHGPRPPTSAKPGTPKKKAVSGTSPDQGAAVDALAVENSKLDAKLKTICRGC